jgi:hypothetical protein
MYREFLIESFGMFLFDLIGETTRELSIQDLVDSLLLISLIICPITMFRSERRLILFVKVPTRQKRSIITMENSDVYAQWPTAKIEGNDYLTRSLYFIQK